MCGSYTACGPLMDNKMRLSHDEHTLNQATLVLYFLYLGSMLHISNIMSKL